MWGQVLAVDPNFVDHQFLFLWLLICLNSTPCASSAGQGQGSATTGQTTEVDLHHEKEGKKFILSLLHLMVLEVLIAHRGA